MRASPVSASPRIGGKEHSQLRVALHPVSVAPYLAAAFKDALGNGNGRPRARCHILDVKYEPSRRCTILYDVDGRLVLGMLGWSEPLSTARDSTRTIDPLEMRAYLFPDDPALPGLATVFDHDALREALASALPDCLTGERRVLRCRATLLRYRPTRRCTARLDLSLGDRRTGAVVPRVLYAKVYHDLTKATCVFADMQMLFGATALQDRGVAVARPVAFLPELATILQEPLTGTPLDALVEHGSGMRGPTEAVLPVADALASIHGTRLQAARRRPLMPALKRMAQRAHAISLVEPELGGRMAALADGLLADADGLTDLGARTSFVHGDCKPSQFLLGSEVAMLDFDHAGTADPACDVGDFLAALRRYSVAGHPLRDVEGRFLARYRERTSPDPGLPARIAWYQALALLRKAIRSFQRSPVSPLSKLLVEESSRCFENWSSGERRP